MFCFVIIIVISHIHFPHIFRAYKWINTQSIGKNVCDNLLDGLTKQFPAERCILRAKRAYCYKLISISMFFFSLFCVWDFNRLIFYEVVRRKAWMTMVTAKKLEMNLLKGNKSNFYFCSACRVYTMHPSSSIKISTPLRHFNIIVACSKSFHSLQKRNILYLSWIE